MCADFAFLQAVVDAVATSAGFLFGPGLPQHLSPSRLAMLLAGVVLAFASACGLAPASADIITVNVTVTTTHDPAGLFGSLGSDISVVYTLDTSLGIFSGNDIYSEVHGGTVYGLTSPSLGATVTTAARTITYGGAYNAQLYGFNNGSRVCPV